MRAGTAAGRTRAMQGATRIVIALALTALSLSTANAATPFLPAKERDWPFVANLEGQCSGVLIAPRLLLYAAHCGAFKSVTLLVRGKRWVHRIERCEAYPSARLEGGNDIAFCVLARGAFRVMELPQVIPPSADEIVGAGTRVVVVGFGETQIADTTRPPGLKQQVEMTIGRARGGEVELQPHSGAVCRGDSGAPVFAISSRRAWKLIGIVSYTLEPDCTLAPAYMTRLDHFLGWIQSASGISLSVARRESRKPSR